MPLQITDWHVAWVRAFVSQDAEALRPMLAQTARTDEPDGTTLLLRAAFSLAVRRRFVGGRGGLHRAEPPMLWTIIDESAFRRPAGGPELMREQYGHLLKMAQLPHVDIQILPFDAGPHPGQIGAFTILEIDDQPEIVWMEGPDGGHFVDRADLVAGCIRRYDHLRAAALSPTASRKMITGLLE